ncbi:hypothetical protein GLAREA_11715 [Glarea lozoyensis ATCC 20868]|uniref:Uncharacterized protein n=1 Tax=Glarea lozoyensis (strain ATCC 20868 / MF5171) TaxID=1116229 RepID=S3CIQ0_GLAL2|nr:uncharacterized protein GLAREA_11715 [Glarea lozoyensis ATCC 20868]EPE25134.1 hypothetical protein GLAREA_11715 [Glarea lozoyensis ATCC 20868]
MAKRSKRAIFKKTGEREDSKMEDVHERDEQVVGGGSEPRREALGEAVATIPPKQRGENPRDEDDEASWTEISSSSHGKRSVVGKPSSRHSSESLVLVDDVLSSDEELAQKTADVFMGDDRKAGDEQVAEYVVLGRGLPLPTATTSARITLSSASKAPKKPWHSARARIEIAHQKEAEKQAAEVQKAMQEARRRGRPSVKATIATFEAIKRWDDGEKELEPYSMVSGSSRRASPGAVIRGGSVGEKVAMFGGKDCLGQEKDGPSKTNQR